MVNFKFINPVSIAYLSLLALFLCIDVYLAFESSLSDATEGFQYLFIPFTLDLSDAVGAQNKLFAQLLFLVIAVVSIILYVINGYSNNQRVYLIVSIFGVVSIVLWFGCIAVIYFIMHLH